MAVIVGIDTVSKGRLIYRMIAAHWLNIAPVQSVVSQGMDRVRRRLC